MLGNPKRKALGRIASHPYSSPAERSEADTSRTSGTPDRRVPPCSDEENRTRGGFRGRMTTAGRGWPPGTNPASPRSKSSRSADRRFPQHVSELAWPGRTPGCVSRQG
jgi:hypothetical protein